MLTNFFVTALHSGVGDDDGSGRGTRALHYAGVVADAADLVARMRALCRHRPREAVTSRGVVTIAPLANVTFGIRSVEGVDRALERRSERCPP